MNYDDLKILTDALTQNNLLKQLEATRRRLEARLMAIRDSQKETMAKLMALEAQIDDIELDLVQNDADIERAEKRV